MNALGHAKGFHHTLSHTCLAPLSTLHKAANLASKAYLSQIDTHASFDIGHETPAVHTKVVLYSHNEW